MKGTRTSKEYVGGNVEYYDWVYASKMKMLQLYGFYEELGFEETERPLFWHKIEPNSSNGRYLENDADVFTIKDNIPANHQLEIYIAYEFDDDIGSSGETGSEKVQKKREVDQTMTMIMRKKWSFMLVIMRLRKMI